MCNADQQDDMALPEIADQLRRHGRSGDTLLAHINPQEAEMLKAAGGSGTINPKTGLPEFANLGGDTEKNALIVKRTKYPGDFDGKGAFQNWLSANPKKRGAYEVAINEIYTSRGLPAPYPNARDWGEDEELNREIADRSGYLGHFYDGALDTWATSADPEAVRKYKLASNIVATRRGSTRPFADVRDFGSDPFLNERIAQFTMYPGDFVDKEFENWLAVKEPGQRVNYERAMNDVYNARGLGLPFAQHGYAFVGDTEGGMKETKDVGALTPLGVSNMGALGSNRVPDQVAPYGFSGLAPSPAPTTPTAPVVLKRREPAAAKPAPSAASPARGLAALFQ